MFEFNTPLGKIKCLKESGESVSFEVAASDEKSHCRAKVYDDALEEWFSVEMVIYGELEIIGLDDDCNVIWRAGSRDVITDFKILEDRIQYSDCSGNDYEIGMEEQ